MCEDMAGLFLIAPSIWVVYGWCRKTPPERARSHVGGGNLVYRHIFQCVKTWLVYLWIVPSIKYGCLFCGWNRKIRNERARSHVGGWNFVHGHFQCVKTWLGYIWIAPPIEVVFCGRNRKTGPGEARSHIGGWNFVHRHIFLICEDLAGFLDCTTIYRGSLFFWTF